MIASKKPQEFGYGLNHHNPKKLTLTLQFLEVPKMTEPIFLKVSPNKMIGIIGITVRIFSASCRSVNRRIIFRIINYRIHRTVLKPLQKLYSLLHGRD